MKEFKLPYYIKIYYYFVIKGELKIVSKVNLSAPDDQTSSVFNFNWVFGYGMSMDLHWMTPNWFGTWSGLGPTHLWPS